MYRRAENRGASGGRTERLRTEVVDFPRPVASAVEKIAEVWRFLPVPARVVAGLGLIAFLKGAEIQKVKVVDVIYDSQTAVARTAESMGLRFPSVPLSIKPAEASVLEKSVMEEKEHGVCFSSGKMECNSDASLAECVSPQSCEPEGCFPTLVRAPACSEEPGGCADVCGESCEITVDYQCSPKRKKRIFLPFIGKGRI